MNCSINSANKQQCCKQCVIAFLSSTIAVLRWFSAQLLQCCRTTIAVLPLVLRSAIAVLPLVLRSANAVLPLVLRSAIAVLPLVLRSTIAVLPLVPRSIIAVLLLIYSARLLQCCYWLFSSTIAVLLLITQLNYCSVAIGSQLNYCWVAIDYSA